VYQISQHRSAIHFDLKIMPLRSVRPWPSVCLQCSVPFSPHFIISGSWLWH